MVSRRTRAAVSQAAESSVSVTETLSKLGMTQEQFQAKQAELLSVLLQNQPFVPQNANTRQLTTYEKAKLVQAPSTRSRSSSVSSTSSRASSPVVSRTPVKPNHADIVPPRPRDQMELILEERNRRKELQRRGSISRPNDGERVFSTPSRGSERFQPPNLPPNTPHHYKYYSERVVGEASSSKRTLDAEGIPETPSRNRERGRFKIPPSRYPKTPSKKGTGSSCPPTPRSSSPPVVNLVSSPGPMRLAPLEEDHLPFTLPPGPYSTAKPDLSYAAIIGRAILASPQHALALQDIYEYITTVFPHYKRGEPTWMNSVRHALSTMAVFRKVQRGRAEGKSLWAIYDCDIPCFQGGGFKKALCADMNNATASSRSRKRGAEDGGGSRSKRKKTSDEQSGSQPIMMPAPVLPPYFPHITNTNPHHQSYYQAALQQQQIPAETLFPPLPPSSNYHRVVARAAPIPVMDKPIASSSSDASANEFAETDQEDDLILSSPIERPPSSSSLPDLVFNTSGSSSPALSSHHSLRGDSREPSPTFSSMTAPTMRLPTDDDIDPMAAWLRSDSPPLVSTVSAPLVSDFAKRDEVASPKPSEKKLPRVMGPPSSPSPKGRKASLARWGLGNANGKRVTSLAPTSGTRPSTPPPTNGGNVMRAFEHASGRASLLHPLLVASELADVSDSYEEQERPCTPDRPVTPPPPSTPSRSDLPSTPSRLAQIESEFFDFSPLKSAGYSHARLTPMLPRSPSLSVFNSRAPLLRMGSIDDFLAADPLPLPVRSLAALPRTPKKSPPSIGYATPSLSAMSPFGALSRGLSDLDDDLARYFQSPRNVAYESMVDGPSSNTDTGSPSGFVHW